MKPRPFDFGRDTFAFANELVWEYDFDPAGGRPTTRRRQPPPTYSHRCFVVVRSARQFLYHARFEPGEPALDDRECARRIRRVVRRSPRRPCADADRIAIPGHGSLREFSGRHPGLLKACCGGAWQSYVLTSHWRMVFPISRRHQERTAAALAARIAGGACPIVHLVLFPQLTINHGMILFAAAPAGEGIAFQAYDPNTPEHPVPIHWDPAERAFSMPPSRYWPGGRLNVIEIFT